MIQRAGSTTPETLHADPTWAYDMQFNFVYTKWESAAPYVIHAGDTIRTNCSWDNTTTSAVQFPREMCVGLGLALVSPDNPRAPGCLNGAWQSDFL